MNSRGNKSSWPAIYLQRPDAGMVLRVLLFAAGYFALQKFSFTLQNKARLSRSPIYMPIALILAVLVVTPKRQWWLYFVTLIVLQFPLFAGNTNFGVIKGLESVVTFALSTSVAAHLITRKHSTSPFDGRRAFLTFLFLALVVVPFVTVAPVHLLRLRTVTFAEIWPTGAEFLLGARHWDGTGNAGVCAGSDVFQDVAQKLCMATWRGTVCGNSPTCHHLYPHVS